MSASGAKPVLIVITGATGSGKSDLAVSLARRLGTEIVSADSRQIYSGLPIGTAQPTPAQLATVKHHFVAALPLDARYSAAQFEADALRCLREIWGKSDYAVMCGGSMMYVDAVTDGIDDLPEISDAVRRQVLDIHSYGGLEAVRAMLGELDPESLGRVDPLNPRRNIHALEICLQSGYPASSLLSGERKERPFRILKFHLDMPREELFRRINLRTEAMVESGLVEEARSLYPMRSLNALNTVGYKEMFAYFDGTYDLATAIARIQKNTRVYAKKQLTWLSRPSVRPSEGLFPDTALETILSKLDLQP